MQRLQVIYAISSLLFASELVLSQTTYYTGFDDLDQNSSWSLLIQGDSTPVNEWQVSNAHNLTPPNSLEHLYPVMGQTLVDNYFVSPAFNFSNGGMIDSISHRFSGFGTPMGEDTIGIYLLVGGNTPSTASSSFALKIFTDSEYINDGNWRTSKKIVIPSVSGESYLAFRYSTTVNWLDVQFDELYVSGGFIVGKEDAKTQSKLKITSNPVARTISFNQTLYGEYRIFTVHGRLVKTGILNSNFLNVEELPRGTYIFNSEHITKQIVKL